MQSVCRSAPTTHPAPRDWEAFPAIVNIEQPKVLYALGDTHGDDERLTQLLIATHVIATPSKPHEVQWTAGHAVLVCTGDFIDKYEHSIEVIDLLRELQTSAGASGGRVIVTLGNHEAEFLAGHGANGKALEFSKELRAQQLDPAAVAAGEDARGIGRWLRSLPVAVKVGDWFFCHAGNTHGLSLDQLTTAIQGAVDEHDYDAPILLDANSMLEARMHPRPWWDYDGSVPGLKPAAEEPAKRHREPADPGQQRLRGNIAALGTKHLVFGHQPGEIEFLDGSRRLPGVIAQKFDGLVFFIDTGMSRGASGGVGGVLKMTSSADGSVLRITASADYADGHADVLLKQ